MARSVSASAHRTIQRAHGRARVLYPCGRRGAEATPEVVGRAQKLLYGSKWVGPTTDWGRREQGGDVMRRGSAACRSCARMSVRAMACHGVRVTWRAMWCA